MGLTAVGFGRDGLDLQDMVNTAALEFTEWSGNLLAIRIFPKECVSIISAVSGIAAIQTILRSSPTLRTVEGDSSSLANTAPMGIFELQKLLSIERVDTESASSVSLPRKRSTELRLEPRRSMTLNMKSSFAIFAARAGCLESADSGRTSVAGSAVELFIDSQPDVVE